MSSPRITTLFHTSATVAAFLPSPAGRGLVGDLLVECATRPALSYALNLEIPSNYPGVAGLLSGADVAALAHSTDALPAPIILAAGAGVSPSVIRSALMRLLRPDERMNNITLLVPAGDAKPIGAPLAAGDRYAVAWDIAEFPHEELIDFGRWIAAERLFDHGNFAGIFPYATGPIEPAHRKRVTDLLAPLAMPGAPIGITLLS